MRASALKLRRDHVPAILAAAERVEHGEVAPSAPQGPEPGPVSEAPADVGASAGPPQAAVDDDELDVPQSYFPVNKA